MSTAYPQPCPAATYQYAICPRNNGMGGWGGGDAALALGVASRVPNPVLLLTPSAVTLSPWPWYGIVEV